MEWILGLLGGSGATIGIILVSNIIKAGLSVKAYRESPRKFAIEQGYHHSKSIRKAIGSYMDEETFEEVLEYLSNFPNDYDKGWDAGLMGLPMPEL